VLYCFSLQSCNKTTTFEREFTIVVLDSITHEPLQGICVQFYQNDGYSTYEIGARKSYESEMFETDENGKVVHSFNPFKNRRDPYIQLRIGTSDNCYEGYRPIGSDIIEYDDYKNNRKILHYVYRNI